MKAFLLAAGKGTRLRPLTDTLPKCLVPVDGKPLLGIWFDLLRHHGVSEVLLNTHHLPEQVEAYVRHHTPAGLRVHLFHEPELLGSAGTVAANRDFVRGEKLFWVLYADNLTDLNLSKLQEFHHQRQSPFTMGLFKTPEPQACGIALLDETGRVVEFIEKPKHPKSDWANSGVYLAGPDMLELLPPAGFCDFGFDVLPRLVGRMYGYKIHEYYCDLGTPERLERGRRDWPLVADRSFIKMEAAC